MPLEVGMRLGPYEIAGSLGAGGMGEVYRATDTSLGREVAIKTLPAGLANDPDRLARFEREAQLLAALNHPHIAAVYSLDAHDGIRYLAMELVDGETLEQKLQSGALPVDDALRLALQIAEALEAAHGKGVVHRDLKPANVMVTPEGNVKVLDFGLAKAFAGDPNEATPAHSPALSLAMTQQGLILGTAGYMSPEQASGQPADQRADVWAFGIVVYEMLTGMPVFSGESVPHILAGVLRLDPEWERLPKDLHPALRRMLERCLTKNVRNRYHAIADARIDIEEALSDPDGRRTGLSVATGTAGAPAGRPLWRRALPWATGLLLAGAAGVAAWTTKPVEPLPVIRATHVLPDGNTWRNRDRSIIAISPDGSQIIYNSQQGLYLRSLDSLEQRLIPGTEGQLGSPVFSPDGQWIAYIRPAVGGGPELVKLPVVGGVAVGLAALPTTPFDVTWDEQDRILLGFPLGVAAVSANGGLIEAFETEQRVGIVSVSMLPGGNTLLVGDITGQVAVWPPGADVPTRLFPGSGPRYVSTGHVVYFDEGTLFAVPFDPASLTVTGGPVPLVDGIMGPEPQFDISASGTLVWVPGSFGTTAEARELAFVDRDGVTVRLELPEEPYRSPRLSPDGTRVAVELVGADGMSNVWLYDLSGEAQIRQLTRGGNNTRPIWTPDGARVTFASDRDGLGIWWQNADFSGVAERLTTSDVEQRPGSWDPAGQVLAFTTVLSGGGGGALGISTFSLDTGETSVFYDLDGSNQESPAFSPDGKWIAYSSFEPGNESSQVFLQPYPPTGEVHPITTTGEAHPLWSPDGSELFFRRSTSAIAVPAISYVSIRTEPSVTWGRQQTLPIDNFFVQTQERSFDITPDGERLLIALPAGAAEASDDGEPRINIVVNWLEEVRQRVPTD